MPAPGDVAVDPVGGAQHGEEDRRRREGVLDEQQPHEDRKAQQAGEGDGVGHRDDSIVGGDAHRRIASRRRCHAGHSTIRVP